MANPEQVVKKMKSDSLAKAMKSINQAKKLKALWLREEAKAILWDGINNIVDDPGGAQEVADILDLDLEELGNLNPQAVLKDLADISLENALDFVHDDGVDFFVDTKELAKIFEKELGNVKVR